MRLIFATDDLALLGRSFAGFPLLLNDDCTPMEPAQTYLWHLLGKPGRIGSKKTWKKYGRDLYDFFAFVQANNIGWTQRPEAGLPGPIDRYVEWSKGTLRLNNNTINGRVRLVLRFYKWALRNGYVQLLPFEEITVPTSGRTSFLTHIEENPKAKTSSDVLLKQVEPVIELLTKSQLAVCLDSLTNQTHRLILEVITRSGLRQEEVRTLPEKYIFDPARRRDLIPGQMLMIRLDPHEMKTKGSKGRVIEMPYTLMEDLWWWSVRHRPARAAQHKSGTKPTSLFLNEAGSPYGASAFTSIFNRLSRKVGFPVRPHMGRHTYATYRLLSLKQSRTFTGDPLLYLMDRLGHSSATTTARYLKYINMLAGELVTQHEDELDELFARRSA